MCERMRGRACVRGRMGGEGITFISSVSVVLATNGSFISVNLRVVMIVVMVNGDGDDSGDGDGGGGNDSGGDGDDSDSDGAFPTV